MKTYITLGVIAASAIALAACGQGKESSGRNKAAAAAPAPAASTTNAAAPAAPGAAQGVTMDATNQNFTIRNRTGHAIRELYVSAVTTNDWEEDVLGRDTLPDGEATEVRFERAETQCNWDIKVVLDNDQSLEERNVNLCQTAEIEVAP